MSFPIFSVVTPTYNRAHLIHRVFDSLMSQSFKSFEWIVIDDGSQDNTENIINKFLETTYFKIKYFKTINQGKAKALNYSMQHCEGKLYLVLDSDDWCDHNALEIFFQEFSKLTTFQLNEYFALSCLKRYKNGKVVGDDYSLLDKYNKTYIDRINMDIKGDKWECLFMDKIIGHYYPVVKDEKYMAPGYLWLKLAGQGYKTIFINQALSTIEYQLDGISRNNFKHRINSVKSTINYYKDFYILKDMDYLKGGRYYANFIRFSLHGKENRIFSFKFFPFYILGLIMFLYDSLSNVK